MSLTRSVCSKPWKILGSFPSIRRFDRILNTQDTVLSSEGIVTAVTEIPINALDK